MASTQVESSPPNSVVFITTVKARLVRAYFLFSTVVTNTTPAKYPMHINEITQRLPSFRAQVRIQQQTITTELQAANITQARLLLQNLYGTGRVLSLLAV